MQAWSQAYLAEEQRYFDELAAVVDISDLRALATATPATTQPDRRADRNAFKNMDKIDAPRVRRELATRQYGVARSAQALFADGALNGIFTILVDYYDQSLRPTRRSPRRGSTPLAACADFDTFAVPGDMIDGELDDLVPGFASWSSCEGLDELGIAIDRANLQALVEVPAALTPLAEFGGDWDVDPRSNGTSCNS
ncbi:MAG: hypothetical protein R2855_02745 [Thermomicrobiales bacterium]